MAGHQHQLLKLQQLLDVLFDQERMERGIQIKEFVRIDRGLSHIKMCQDVIYLSDWGEGQIWTYRKHRSRRKRKGKCLHS